MLNASGIYERKLASGPHHEIWIALRAGLERFQRANLIEIINEDGERKYTVNHEAFIRGWETYRDWFLHASKCKDRLVDIDSRVRQQLNPIAPPQLFNQVLVVLGNLFFASHLQWAALAITDESAGLLNDVLGPNSTYSRAWAREILTSHDAGAGLSWERGVR